MDEIDIGTVVACLAGALLGEGIRPSPTWRGSTVNVLLGLSVGAFGPQGLEMWWERFARMHRLTTFACALSGSILCRSFLGWVASKRPEEIVSLISSIRAGRSDNPPAGSPPSNPMGEGRDRPNKSAG